MIGIYKIENLINHKKYIGQSVNIRKRWEYHRCVYTQILDKQLYMAMRKYGIENFSFEIVEECPIDKLLEREIYWINYYDTYVHGYNANPGGTGGITKAISQYDLNGKLIKNYSSLTDAADELNLNIDIISACLNKLQKSHGGYMWTYYGESAPEPYIDKRYGHTTSSNKRIIEQYDKEDKYINEYESAHEAARQIGKPKCANHITECCQGKRKTCEGYIWRYKDNGKQISTEK